ALTGKTQRAAGTPAMKDQLPPPNSQVPQSELGVDQVCERWNVVVQELNRRGAKSAAALLTGAQPLRCDNGVLVIGFQYDTHRELLERGENKQRLAAALVAVFGQPLQVRSELLGDQMGSD